MKLLPIGYNHNTTQRNTTFGIGGKVPTKGIDPKGILSSDLTPEAIKTICKVIKEATGLDINPEILKGDSVYRKYNGKREIVDRDILNDECSVRYFNDENRNFRAKDYKYFPLPKQLALHCVRRIPLDGYSIYKYYNIFSGDISTVRFNSLFEKENNKNFKYFIDFNIKNGEIIKIEKF